MLAKPSMNKHNAISPVIAILIIVSLFTCMNSMAKDVEPQTHSSKPAHKQAMESKSHEQHRNEHTVRQHHSNRELANNTHWTYTGNTAAHAWGKLKKEYHLCSDGKSQSPIDISSVVISPLDNIHFNYQQTPMKVLNNGHTIKVSYEPGSYITVAGKTYELLQFHFHSPSEHTIGGKAFDMVAHLVHKANDDQLGVIGVLFKIGLKENFFIRKLWNYLPSNEGEKRISNTEKLNVQNMLPISKQYFNYSGSLTTPPCSEDVNWMLMASPVSISKEQVEAFTRVFAHSTRPVNPVNGRTITLQN